VTAALADGGDMTADVPPVWASTSADAQAATAVAKHAKPNGDLIVVAPDDRLLISYYDIFEAICRLGCAEFRAAGAPLDAGWSERRETASSAPRFSRFRDCHIMS
jgi:hypothetical protein